MTDVRLIENAGKTTVPLVARLEEDIRFQEGLKACMNCGVCTASCPAAAFFDYDPRLITDIVQKRDEEKLAEILKGEQIWYCGQCMSCKTRCPRGNTPGLIIQALRGLSQELGYFVASKQGWHQLEIQRLVGENILRYGYCVYPDAMRSEDHPEQGPVWKWQKENLNAVSQKTAANYKGTGSGALRRLDDEVLKELHRIFEVTGAFDRFANIEHCCKNKANDLSPPSASRAKQKGKQ